MKETNKPTDDEKFEQAIKQCYLVIDDYENKRIILHYFG